VLVACDGREVFRAGRISADSNDPTLGRLPLSVPGPLPWELLITPKAELLSVLDSPLPEVALGSGFVIAFLLALTVRFGDLAYRRARRLEDAVRERTAELQETTEKLRATNEAKDSFIQMLGHELRNPLGTIRTALGAMHEEGGGSGLEMRPVIDRQVDQMTRLVDDLLEVSQIARAKLTLQYETLDLAELARTVGETFRPRARDAGLTLHLELPERSVWVRVDPLRMQQVLTNLLANALKFTDRGGTLRIRLRERAETAEAELAVVDTGCGIEEGDLERIFEPFEQTEAARGRMTGGLGLGLPIVKGLIEAQGGSVAVESPGRDEGSTFRLRFPTVEPPAEQPRPAATPAPSIPRRILIIDDHRDSADALRLVLSGRGSEVAVAYDGPEGIRKAADFHPEVLICDLGLPGMDGLEIARRLRAEPVTRSIRLLALTGFGGEETAAAVQSAGFERHLTKPVDLDLLMRTLAGTP
jgi:signal transduction histidine kinase/CheY-like chemotaxis protein